MKEPLKRQILECLLLILVIGILGYVVIVYPLLLLGAMPRTDLLASYYGAFFGGAYFCVWVYFVVSRFAIKQCGNCGSRNICFSFIRGGFCGNCGYAVKADAPWDVERLWRFMAKAMTILFLPSGVFMLMGSTLVGITLDLDIVRFAIHLSVLTTLLSISVMALIKLFYNATYFNEHRNLASILIVTIILILTILLFIVFDAVIFYLLHWLFP